MKIDRPVDLFQTIQKRCSFRICRLAQQDIATAGQQRPVRATDWRNDSVLR